MSAVTLNTDNTPVGYLGTNSPVLVNVSGNPIEVDGLYHPLDPALIVPEVSRIVRLGINRGGQELLFLELTGDSDSHHALEVLQRDLEERYDTLDSNPVLLVGTLEMAKAYPGLVVAPILLPHYEEDPDLMEVPTYCGNRFLTYGAEHPGSSNRWHWNYTLVKVQPQNDYISVST